LKDGLLNLTSSSQDKEKDKTNKNKIFFIKSILNKQEVSIYRTIIIQSHKIKSQISAK
jgi:hypothetical protein